jgi:carboxypeptidase C (cathepsin A)
VTDTSAGPRPQEQPGTTHDKGKAKVDAYERPAGARSRQTIRLDGADVAYDVVADWMVLRRDDEPVAEMFHVAYLLADADAESRPITFVFNGGPGASSAYLHIGALGPRRVAFDEGGRVPAPPVRLVDNQETWLAFTDLVFVDPVGTGFSRAIQKDATAAGDKAAPGADQGEKEFFAIGRDLESLGELIQRFLSAHHRWTSPVLIAGESYGGFRAGKLSRKLQEGFGIGLNGAILISPALEFAQLVPTDYEVLHFIDALPTMAAAAHAHGRGRALAAEAPLDDVLRAAEAFAARDLAEVLVRGDRVDPARRKEVFARMADFLGVSEEAATRTGGRMRITHFARELLRDRGEVCGLYDARITARDPYPDRELGEGPDPTLFAIERVFNAGINAQLRSLVGIETERTYRLLSLDVNRAWKVDGEQHALDRHVGATDDLRYALSLNPHMRVLVSHGLYDLVTPYFASDRILGHMRLDDVTRGRIELQHFPGGHMFYTVDSSRKAFRDAGARFVRACTEGAR